MLHISVWHWEMEAGEWFGCTSVLGEHTSSNSREVRRRRRCLRWLQRPARFASLSWYDSILVTMRHNTIKYRLRTS